MMAPVLPPAPRKQRPPKQDDRPPVRVRMQVGLQLTARALRLPLEYEAVWRASSSLLEFTCPLDAYEPADRELAAHLGQLCHALIHLERIVCGDYRWASIQPTYDNARARWRECVELAQPERGAQP